MKRKHGADAPVSQLTRVSTGFGSRKSLTNKRKSSKPKSAKKQTSRPTRNE